MAKFQVKRMSRVSERFDAEEKKLRKEDPDYAEDTGTMAISTWMWSLASKQAEDLFYDTVTPRSGETKPAPPGAVFK